MFVANLAFTNPDAGALEAAQTLRAPYAEAIGRGSWFMAAGLLTSAYKLFRTRPEFDTLALVSLTAFGAFESMRSDEAIAEIVGRERTDTLIARAANLTVAEAARDALAALDHVIDTDGNEHASIHDPKINQH